MEVTEELVLRGVTVWRVVLSWGFMLSVGVLFFVESFLLVENLLELSSLVCEAILEEGGEFIKFEVEALSVLGELGVKVGFGVNFSLSELVSQSLAGFIESGSLGLSEGGECFALLVENLGESLSCLANSFSDGSGLGFEELDEVELVVGVVHELDLLELSCLGSIESSLLLSERVFESGSLGVNRLSECVHVMVECIVEGSCISYETCMESSSLAI